MLDKAILEKKEPISVIGLGYVGMPLAIALAKKFDVIGLDNNPEKIALYLQGIDPTNEVGDDVVEQTSMKFTNDEHELQKSRFHIIAVPTPITSEKTPDLLPIKEASRTVGRHLRKGAIVVYESTVYPGATEEVCVPILEQESGLTYGRDFTVGYSPERINPGDKVHTLEKIVKIVSATDRQSLRTIGNIYSEIIEAGVHEASSIQVAEAAKVVENSQRDINIAFMNELAMVFDKMGINTTEVLAAMQTKWNALHFYPGLVGGHCIGIDPYYFISKAETLGYHSQIIAAGRKVNDAMGEFVADCAIKALIQNGNNLKNARIGVLGLTFKENCPDVRNTKVIDIIHRLKSYGLNNILVSDCWADREEVRSEYQIELVDLSEMKDLDCLIVAVSHNEYRQLSLAQLQSMFDKQDPVLIDVKEVFPQWSSEFRYWSL